MSEAPTVLDAAPAAGPSTLSPDQIAGAREHWASLGLNPADFDAAVTAAVSFDQPNERGEPAVEVLSDLKTPTLTEAEARAMAAELIRAGMPREHVEAALEADGYALADDPRSEEEREFDAALGAVPPEAYRIDFRGRLLAGLDPAQVAGGNAEFQAWLSATGFPPDIGPAVVERALDVALRCKAMSDAERELFKREQEAAFIQMAGSEERALELADLAEAALARGGSAMWAALAASGALDDAGMIMHLALQGERLATRSDLAAGGVRSCLAR